jgi:hypothetical protein
MPHSKPFIALATIVYMGAAAAQQSQSPAAVSLGESVQFGSGGR